MYEFFQRHGLRASEVDFALQAKVLGPSSPLFPYVCERDSCNMGTR